MRPIDEAQQGQRVAIAAVPGFLFACLALVGGRRRALLALVAAGFALVAALLAPSECSPLGPPPAA